MVSVYTLPRCRVPEPKTCSRGIRIRLMISAHVHIILSRRSEDWIDLESSEVFRNTMNVECVIFIEYSIE